MGTAGIEPATPAMSTQCSPAATHGSKKETHQPISRFKQLTQQLSVEYQWVVSKSSTFAIYKITVCFLSKRDRIVTHQRPKQSFCQSRMIAALVGYRVGTGFIGTYPYSYTNIDWLFPYKFLAWHRFQLRKP